MTNAGALLAVTLAVPLAMLAACLSERLRNGMPALMALAPMPALATALLTPDGSTVVLPGVLLGLTLALDTPGAMLLGTAALLWVIAGAYACAYLRNQTNRGRFVVWWLMTLTGSLGVFIAADMAGFYLFFTLVSLAAYGLVAFDSTHAAKHAAGIYVGLAILGEAFLLMGFVLAAAGTPDSLFIRDAVAALPNSPWRDPAMALIILGFGVKIGLVPLHVWMPLAYTAAPIPVAAVLSGAAVKAGVIGLIRFMPLETAMPGWGEALAAVGLFSAFYGVAIGITQTNPKTVLAYSSVSQMGLLAAALGMGLAAGDKSVAIVVAFCAVHHILVKGGLFLALGVAGPDPPRRLWPVLLPAAVLALGLGGLPLTGGALAKLALKPPMGSGIVGTLAMLSAIGSTLLMLHFLHRLTVDTTSDSGPIASAGPAPPSLTWLWLTIAFAAIVVPWLLYPAMANGSLQAALAPSELWAALWPVLIGGVLSTGLWRWEQLLPRVPAGDLLAAGGGAVRATRNLGGMMERIDDHLRQWPVAGVLFLTLTAVLAVAMIIAH